MKKFKILAVGILLCGCASAGRHEAAYDTLPPQDDVLQKATTEQAEYDFEEEEVDFVGEGQSMSKKRSTQSTGAPSSSLKLPKDINDINENIEKPKGEQPNKQMVVYSGYLQLRVKRMQEAIDQITELVNRHEGYIDSLTPEAVTVRVPSKDFEAAMQKLAAVGDLLDRWVRAQDVSARFTDLSGRLAVAKEARERLLKLLEKETDTIARLAVLQEIKRLSEQIDTIESSLAAIRNLADYCTITIDLVPVLETTQADTGLSLFCWIRELKAHAQTLYSSGDAVSMTLPKGFVLFEEDYSFRAQAADTTIIRAAAIENDPVGDNRFWADAVDFEMKGRQEKIAASDEVADLTYRIYENDDVTPRFYLVALRVKEDKIYVIEVFFPNKDAYKRHREAVLKALETLEVK